MRGNRRVLNALARAGFVWDVCWRASQSSKDCESGALMG